MKLIFVKARPTDSERSNEREERLTLQLVVDEVGKAKPQGHAVGWRGMPTRNEDVFPFLLQPDGVVDFGGGYAKSDASRFGECDVYQQDEVVRGGKFIFPEDEDTTEYQVDEVQEILIGASLP